MANHNIGKYVVMALFVFDDGYGPYFDRIVGIASTPMDAFDILEAYDYKKVIAAGNEMTITEVGKVRKEFGTNSDYYDLAFYDEKRHFNYQIVGAEEKGSVFVEFTIYET